MSEGPNELLLKTIEKEINSHRQISPGQLATQKHVEWTIASAIICSFPQKESIEEGVSGKLKEEEEERCSVVSIGFGLKCLGASLKGQVGEILHDSHAEVIARRAFIKYVFWFC